MSQLIQPFDDVAMFKIDGNFATWMSSGHVVAALVEGGLISPEVTVVKRIALEAFTLVGDAPTEAAYIGASRPGRTVPTDFAAHWP